MLAYFPNKNYIQIFSIKQCFSSQEIMLIKFLKCLTEKFLKAFVQFHRLIPGYYMFIKTSKNIISDWLIMLYIPVLIADTFVTMNWKLSSLFFYFKIY